MSTNGSDISDEQLLNLLRLPGEQERAFRYLITKYQEPLYRHRRMVHDHEDSNDVLQNCFIKAFRGIASFRGNSSLFTWLYRIATNEAITYIKKRKRRLSLSIDGEAQAAVQHLQSDTYFDGDKAQALLNQAIGQLPEKQKVVFNLRYFEEMPYQDISAILGTSTGALKASYHHAVKKIEAYFKKVKV